LLVFGTTAARYRGERIPNVRYRDINVGSIAQACNDLFTILPPAAVINRLEYVDLGKFRGPFAKGSMSGCSTELAERLVRVFPSRLSPCADSWGGDEARALAQAIEVGDEELCGKFGRRIQGFIDAELRPAGLSADVADAEAPFPATDVTENVLPLTDGELREEMLAWALNYAAKGKPVFPCSPDTKRPLAKRGFKDASLDPEVITEWWTRWPRAMIGMPTGAASGIFVVDLDCKDDVDGHRSYAALGLHEMGTAAALTPSGGAHLYFVWREGFNNSAGVIGPCIDGRGDGGYVIVPPSMRADGTRYRWRGEGAKEIAEIPQIIVDRLEQHRRRHETQAGDAGQSSIRERVSSGRRPKPNGDGRNRAYAEAVLKGECELVANSGKGVRNSTLNTAALKVGHYVAGGELGKAEATEALFQAAVACGLVDDDGPKAARDTIRSGLQAGMQEPRTAPESDFVPRRSIRDSGRHVASTEAGTANQDEPVDPVIEQMNSEHCVIANIGGKCRVMCWDRSGPYETPVFQTFADFRNRYANQFVTRKQTIADLWIKHPQHQQYEGLTFRPGDDRRVIDGYLNLWRGFGVKPAAGDWSLMEADLKASGQMAKQPTDQLFRQFMIWRSQGK
jgi:Bifunctional DNA primase/polymerase, N-terminal